MKGSDGLGALHRFEIMAFGGGFLLCAVVATAVISLSGGVLEAALGSSLGLALGIFTYRGFRQNIVSQFDGRLRELTSLRLERPVVSVLRVAIASSPVTGFLVGLACFSPVTFGAFVAAIMSAAGISLILAVGTLIRLERERGCYLVQSPVFRRGGFSGGPYALVSPTSTQRPATTRSV